MIFFSLFFSSRTRARRTISIYANDEIFYILEMICFSICMWCENVRIWRRRSFNSSRLQTKPLTMSMGAKQAAHAFGSGVASHGRSSHAGMRMRCDAARVLCDRMSRARDCKCVYVQLDRNDMEMFGIYEFGRATVEWTCAHVRHKRQMRARRRSIFD